MTLPRGFVHYRGYFDPAAQVRLLRAVRAVIARAPLFQPEMPRTGRPFSVKMTNCGKLGWVSDRERGYRYQPTHPDTDEPWPAIPSALRTLWRDVAGYRAPAEACLVNWYAPGARMGLHVDRDENDFTAPVVSVSLGDDAWFRVGGPARSDPAARVLLRSGDVAVLGGQARLSHHGIDRILAGTGTLLDEPGRINLTLRRVTATRPGWR